MSNDVPAGVPFGGVVRLFPLPNLVLFPQVMQPLHVFEPRYRQMTADALGSDRFIAIVLLQSGWEADYAGCPALYSVACLCRIVAEQRLDDGRFNILLRGLSRIQITQEIQSDMLYRSARAELLADTNVPGPGVDRKIRRQLARQVLPWFAEHAGAQQQLRKLLKSHQPLGMLSDMLTFALPLAVEVKQELLELLNVERRARRLLQYMEKGQPVAAAGADKRPFPPEFSNN
jgi:Lon protease-like protein